MHNIVLEFCNLIWIWHCFSLISDEIGGWQEEQTITTLDSIATPIQQVQFPTGR